ncbi:putative protein kinase RLK-Pelle-LRR-XI-1 family [Helianthus annuus]|nr:putative protein kinase RLK-Pelle-LRR-XI-1 family [Helianthus annuus]
MPPPIITIILLLSVSTTTLSLTQEGLDLLQAKSTLSDPTGILSDWNPAHPTPCNWTGITCTHSNSVTGIHLPSASLSGPFPTTLCRLPSLSTLSLHNNNLNSNIPPTISACRNLTHLDLSANYFHGLIPSTLPDIPNLLYLDLQENSLSGEVPATFGNFRRLQILNLTNNLLNGSFPVVLTNLTTLKELVLAYNNFIPGPIPPQLGNLSNVEYLWLSSCGFSGEIPATFSRLTKLSNLELSYNSLTGAFPDIVFELRNLYQLELFNNSFSGELPKKGWSNLTALRRIDLSINHFTGAIPVELCKLPLSSLGLSDNKLQGLIPVSLAKSPNLYDLRLFDNSLIGPIPSDLGKFSTLTTLNYLDLSGNSFSGKIPSGLANLMLNTLNLSNNQLSGEIPSVFHKDVYRDSFLGNPELCGGFSPRCVENYQSKSNHNLWLLRFIFVFSGVVLAIGVIWFVFKYRSIKKTNQGVSISKWRSFHKLGFSEIEIIHLLNENNVIGSGASGKVYKAVLSNGESVAVKKLWEGSVKNDEDAKMNSQKEFESEVETLGKIRHKNIVRLWCCFKSGNSRLLVYEYMRNGSLGDVLHSTKGRLLEWSMRFKIVLDAAEGLSYLHHDCVPPIVHRDVKSNNILLDEDYGARIADFGVAKFINLTNKGSESMSVIAGSRGYIAPEYAYTLRVNEKSDIYSFGVVILELVTGRKPIDPEFLESDLATWVQTTVNEKGHDHVVDPELEYGPKEQIYRVLDIGLLCINPLPMSRPSMRTVVNLLQESAVDGKPKPITNKEGKVSPCFEEEDCSDEASLV